MTPQIVTIGDIAIGGQNPVALISGPCQLESHAHARMICEGLLEACAPTGTKVIFKASYDKANRSSLSGTRGLGMDLGLRILSDIRAEYGVPVLTDVHEPGHCAIAASARKCASMSACVLASSGGRARIAILIPWRAIVSLTVRTRERASPEVLPGQIAVNRALKSG